MYVCIDIRCRLCWDDPSWRHRHGHGGRGLRGGGDDEGRQAAHDVFASSWQRNVNQEEGEESDPPAGKMKNLRRKKHLTVYPNDSRHVLQFVAQWSVQSLLGDHRLHRHSGG